MAAMADGRLKPDTMIDQAISISGVTIEPMALSTLRPKRLAFSARRRRCCIGEAQALITEHLSRHAISSILAESPPFYTR